MAAARADFDAKVAEVRAELEETRGEKEKTNTDLAYLKTSARKERLQWNKERTLLTRKFAEAEARAREAADGLASPQEFLTLQQALASREATINDLRQALEAKEAQQSKLEFEVACASTAEADVDRLMIRVASLEKELTQEGDARIAAEQETEALMANIKILERRLGAAKEAVVRADEEIASCFEDVAKANADVRQAHATQRHAELWLEKSLAEVDAVTAILMYERSVASGADGTCAGGALQAFDTPIHTSLPQKQKKQPTQKQKKRALPPTFYGAGGAGGALDANVMPKLDTLSAAEVSKIAGGSMIGRETPSTPTPPPPQMQRNPDKNLRTPDLDTTAPVLFSTVRTRSRVGGSGHGMGMTGDKAVETATTERHGAGRQEDGSCSPLTPTVLFGDLDREGEPAMRERQAPVEDGEPLRSRLADSGIVRGLEPMFANDIRATTVGGEAVGHVDTVEGEAAPSGTSSAKTDLAFERETRANDEVVSTMSLLQSETKKREGAENKVAGLERGAAAAAVVAENKNGIRNRLDMAKDNQWQTVGSQAQESRNTGQANACHGGDVCPCVRLHRCGGGDGCLEQFNADVSAKITEMNRDTQWVKVSGLVRNARQKMQLLSKKDANGGADCGRELKEGGAPYTRDGTGGSEIPLTEESAWDRLNLVDEVASLIQVFEKRLAQSLDANNQLRDFCSHLEGLLALHEGN